MLSEKDMTRISKFLSLVLRHQPETLGVTLDENGWVDSDILLVKLNEKGFAVTRNDLQYVVATNSKKRFAFNDAETKIRASQGHSIEINLGYEASIPPPVLYHGTAEKNIQVILLNGLLKQGRHHVHLTADKETAIKVGQRHGKPAMLEVKAREMHEDGYLFYISANSVWLTDHVPAKYLQQLQS